MIAANDKEIFSVDQNAKTPSKLLCGLEGVSIDNLLIYN